jgi:hypothetical protein
VWILLCTLRRDCKKERGKKRLVLESYDRVYKAHKKPQSKRLPIRTFELTSQTPKRFLKKRKKKKVPQRQPKLAYQIFCF